jgi:hypothetical protein
MVGSPRRNRTCSIEVCKTPAVPSGPGTDAFIVRALNWCSGQELNLHYAVSEAAVSASWTTGACLMN